MTQHYAEAIHDIIQGVISYPMWGRLGWQDIRRRYRRTIIGPFWTTLSLAIFIVMLGIVWANLWKLDPKAYLPFLSSGMLAWVFFSALITEGCTTFIAVESLIKQLRISYTLLVCALVWRNLLVFAHNFAIYVFVCLYAGLWPNWNTLLVIPGLAVLCINGVWIALMLGLLCARYRDIQQVVTSILQVAMFVTPIFWQPSQLTGRAILFADYNLLYHYVEIVRDPLLGKPPSAWSWLIVTAATIVGWTTTLCLFSRFRHRIPYWL